MLKSESASEFRDIIYIWYIVICIIIYSDAHLDVGRSLLILFPLT